MDTRTGPPRRGRIEGQVLHRDGSPVADASIVIEQAPGPFPDIAPVTDAQGRFSLSDLQPGEWVFSGFGPGSEGGRAAVTVEGDGIAQLIIYAD